MTKKRPMTAGVRPAVSLNVDLYGDLSIYTSSRVKEPNLDTHMFHYSNPYSHMMITDGNDSQPMTYFKRPNPANDHFDSQF